MTSFLLAPVVVAQQMSPASVPHYIRFSGEIRDSSGGPRTGIVGVMLSLYREQEGGAPLWMEVQNLTLDAQGRYSVLLGGKTIGGVPMDPFSSGEARWLGVRVLGSAETERPRVLLVSVPYALKAGDAETLGGLPPSAFLTATSASPTTSSPEMRASGVTPYAITGTVLANYLPKFTDSTGTETDSLLYDSGTRLGVNTTTPGSLVDLWAPLPELRLTSTNATQAGQLSFYDSGALGGFFQYRNASSAVSPKLFQLGGWAAGSQFAILTGATERVRVDAAGNVGIGTTLPVAKLDLIGNLHASGSVGIGTASPSQKLEVAGNIKATGTSGYIFPDSSNQIKAGLTDVSGGGLQVASGSGTKTLSLLSSCATNQILKWSGSAWACSNDLATVLHGGTSNAVTANSVVKFYDTTGTLTPSILFDNGTNVGINTTSPTAPLDLWAALPEMRLTSTDSTKSGQVSFYDGGGLGGFVQYRDASAVPSPKLFRLGGWAVGSQFSIVTAATERVRVDASGNVGIGTTTPAAKLDIIGNLHASGNTTIGGTLTVTGTVSTTGDLHVGGNLTKASGSFKIDHPLDPENKYLYHSFVESPDMMDIYNGNVTLDARGRAWVTLPDWFEALNQDFRYQLTSLGRFAPVYIAREINGNRFLIAGGRAHGKVSWQVTGIRHDAYANAHRIPVEETKPAAERGKYLYPDAVGRPGSQTDAVASANTGADQ